MLKCKHFEISFLIFLFFCFSHSKLVNGSELFSYYVFAIYISLMRYLNNLKLLGHLLLGGLILVY